MKKRNIVLAGVSILMLMSSCQNNISSGVNSSSTSSSTNLTYETDTRFMPTRDENASLVSLTYDEIEAKFAKKESFILLIKHIECSACKTFLPIIEKYIEKNKVTVYAIETIDIPSGAKLYYNYTPTLQIFKNGELVDSKDGSYEETKMFSKYSDLASYLDKFIIVNNQLYISDTTLDNMILNKETFVVYFGWNLCSDCAMMSKLFLNEYLYNTRNENNTLYALEINPWRSQKGENPQVWEDFTTKYHLSITSDAKFGYKTGVVPTIQYYEEGVLTKAVVYFNDIMIDVLDENNEVVGVKINFDVEDGVYSYYQEEIKELYENTIFEDRQDYKEKTNSFYSQKLLELFELAYK